jgi:hypothetical protein
MLLKEKRKNRNTKRTLQGRSLNGSTQVSEHDSPAFEGSLARFL